MDEGDVGCPHAVRIAADAVEDLATAHTAEPMGTDMNVQQRPQIYFHFSMPVHRRSHFA